MRYSALSGIVLVLLLGFAGSAFGAPALFGEFVWGTPRADFAKRPDVTSGTGTYADDLLLPEATFAGLPWTVRLEFDKDRLTRVSLMERYSTDRMSAVTAQLKADKYEMLSVLIDSAYLDLVKVLKTVGPEGVQTEWKRFVQGKSPERMIYAWFDTSKMSKDMKTMAGSLNQLLATGPAETREAEVILLRDPETSRPGMLLVDFSFPAMLQ